MCQSSGSKFDAIATVLQSSTHYSLRARSLAVFQLDTSQLQATYTADAQSAMAAKTNMQNPAKDRAVTSLRLTVAVFHFARCTAAQCDPLWRWLESLRRRSANSLLAHAERPGAGNVGSRAAPM